MIEVQPHAAGPDLRPAAPQDAAAIGDLLRGAFPGPEEANLVTALHRDGDVVLSLVAAFDERVVGHALFSRMKAPFPALGLGPVAVHAAHRCQGVADALIRYGIAKMREDGWDAAFVLGDPAYYTRFGFSVELAAKFSSPFAGPHLMVLGLQTGGLPTLSGAVHYAPAFAELG